jgi:hypothetical protein
MKQSSAFVAFLLICGLVYYSFYSLMPREGSPSSAPETEFSTERALVHLKEISKAPHYHANAEHKRVREYLLDELRKAGLEVETQKGYVSSLNWGSVQKGDSVTAIPAGYSIDKPINIMARIKGSGVGKSLVLLSHYDSAKVPSPGASDAGSGVVTILESLRAYQAAGKTPKNDIIVLFTDAEELGLDGAMLFVKEHPWAKDVGLVLNFEARGSGGPSNMILETNGGNENLINAFIEANPEYPVASSLMYSIYKMLPNDTDSTVFREEGDIDSFFFAFIDDHFDYHTANDTVENLDIETLQHQGSYLLPLLQYFADADLASLKGVKDDVYVNVPLFKMIHYPFSWILPMLLLAVVVFVVLVYYGLRKGEISGKGVGRGFIAMLLSLLVCGLLGFFGWKLIMTIYPEYNEIQHGFKYNGHSYVAFFVFLSLTFTFLIYRRFGRNQSPTAMYVAPLMFWILINVLVYVAIKGAGFFIIPVFFGLLSLWLLIWQEKPSLLLLALLSAPAIFLFAPLIQFFPVGLGSDHVFISCIFTVLLFGLVYSVFGFFKLKRFIASLCAIVALGFFIEAMATSSFTEDRQKPNSLIYYEDSDSSESYWVTYDRILDSWTKGYLGDTPEEASKYISSAAGSKYNTSYSFASEAPFKEISVSRVYKNHDTLIGNERHVAFTIVPQRAINELFVYADTSYTYNRLSFNGHSAETDKNGRALANVYNKRLLRFIVSEGDSLRISYTTERPEAMEFMLVEYSFDLMEHPQFSINKRPANTMPKPFINTDAIVVKKTFSTADLKPLIRDSVTSDVSEIIVPNE